MTHARKKWRSSCNTQSNLGLEFEGEARNTVLEPHLVEANLGFSDDEIEREAVYNNDYLTTERELFLEEG